MEMDRAMATNVWSSYNQPLYQRYCYDYQLPASHHHYHPQRHQMPAGAMTPVFKSSQPYSSLGYTAQPLSVASDAAVPGAWKMVGDGTTECDRLWPAAVTGHVLGRTTDAATTAAAPSQRWPPYPGIGA